MNLIAQLQNFNIVETPLCDLLQNGSFFEMQSYSSPAKRVSDIISTHTLPVCVTDNARLQAHWVGFVTTVEGINNPALYADARGDSDSSPGRV